VDMYLSHISKKVRGEPDDRERRTNMCLWKSCNRLKQIARPHRLFGIYGHGLGPEAT
jgi:hypothetical protein